MSKQFAPHLISSAERALTAQWEELSPLISARTGLIKSLARVSRPALEPTPPILYQAKLAHFDFRRAPDSERLSAGKGETEAQAKLGALGEAVERYCGYHPDHARFRRAAFAEVQAQALAPTALTLYSKRQYSQPGFPYPSFDLQRPMDWIAGRALPDGQELLLPATFVYLNYFGAGPGELLCPPNSNGMAAGPTLEWAILGGLYELIERDAFLVTWMNRLPAPLVLGAQRDDVARSIIEHYRRSGIEVLLFDLTTDIPVPVMMAVALDRAGRGPAMTVGLGCHLNPRVAIKKALFELCQVHAGEAHSFNAEATRARLDDYRKIRTLADHSAFFTLPENLSHAAFLFDHASEREADALADLGAGEIEKDLATVIALLERAGCRTAFVEVTTPDLAGFKLRVVRTLATNLQPIHFGYGEERLGGERLFAVARALGYDDRVRTEEDLHPCPHPLA